MSFGIADLTMTLHFVLHLLSLSLPRPRRPIRLSCTSPTSARCPSVQKEPDLCQVHRGKDTEPGTPDLSLLGSHSTAVGATGHCLYVVADSG
ncbi:hypothetical protein EDB85DRAFT_850298 [Lactarius pseudohatsudake]|nr:hypothetical protein EDB85DRAFT_850298 [Lactarius pseudohatsudake]